MGDTKIIYHIDEEETPYLVKLPIPSDVVTLGDFKNVLNRPSYKYFFKSMDDDFGVVKEEIVDDDAKLPSINGRVVSWLVSAEGSSVSDGTSQCTESDIRVSADRQGTDNRTPAFHSNASERSDQFESTCTETESTISSRRMPGRPMHKSGRHKTYVDHAMRLNGHKHTRNYESSSVMTSDIDTTSFFDSEDDTSSRISSMTEQSSVSRIHGRHKRRRRKHKMPAMSRTSSVSSITDSTMSLNIITVTLNMDTVNFLGISIVGQSNKGGDGGIYVGSIMKGGAVALDGRVEPGDMILQVNDINFENMSNDDAVRVLREAVQKPGPIKLVVAKCWDPNPKGYFTIPRTEPVRPIDPGAWVAHTAAVRGDYPLRPPSVSTLTSTSSSITSSIPESDRQFQEMRLNLSMDRLSIVKAMAAPDSGLDVRDRMWLKITIPKAFIGADVVDWLHTHVDGFADRREARKYATEMLKDGYIRHTVNKVTFSEQCYYVFGDICNSMAALKLEDDSVSEADQNTLGPLPPANKNMVPGQTNQAWIDTQPPSYNYAMQMQNQTFINQFAYSNPSRENLGSYAVPHHDESLHSSGSSNGSDVRKDTPLLGDQHSSGASDSEVLSQHTARRGGGGNSSGSDHSAMTTTTRGSEHPLPVPNRMESMPADVSGSRQSFRMAMAEEDLLDYQYSDKGVV